MARAPETSHVAVAFSSIHVPRPAPRQVLFEVNPGARCLAGSGSSGEEVDPTHLAESTAAQAFQDAALNPDGSMSVSEFRSWYSRYNMDFSHMFRDTWYPCRSKYVADRKIDRKLGPARYFTIFLFLRHMICLCVSLPVCLPVSEYGQPFSNFSRYEAPGIY